MLEHADRDDAVERPFHLAVVLQQELGLVLEAKLLGAAVGDGVLLVRERHADHLDVAMLGEIEAQPAPARADVEHALARLQVQLGGEVALLGVLRFVEAGDAVFPIGAGILQVGVEEERIEPSVEVVVRMDVLLRPAERVDLPETAGGQPPAADGDHPPRRQGVARIAEDHREEVEDRPLFDDHPPFGELLAELEIGVVDDRRLGLAAGEAHAHGLGPPVAEGVLVTLGIDDLERSLANGLCQI